MRLGFDSRIAPNRKILLEAHREKPMLPYSLGKEIEESVENLTTGGCCLLHSPSPK